MVSKLFLTVHILKIFILLFCYCIVLKGLILGILGVLEFLDTFNHKKNILKRKEKIICVLNFFFFWKNLLLYFNRCKTSYNKDKLVLLFPPERCVHGQTPPKSWEQSEWLLTVWHVCKFWQNKSKIVSVFRPAVVKGLIVMCIWIKTCIIHGYIVRQKFWYFVQKCPWKAF